MDGNSSEKRKKELEVVDSTTKQEVLPLNVEQRLEKMSEKDRQEVLALADAIDVTQTENVKNYGASVLKEAFDQSAKYIESEKGSEADQRVIKQVIDISKKVSKSYEDFGIILKEPNFIQKLWLTVKTGNYKKSRADKIKNSAVSNFKLINTLALSYEEWEQMLQKSYDDAAASARSDIKQIVLLDKYICAGRIAQDRIKKELEELRIKSIETGSPEDEQEYKLYSKGAERFDIVLNNLEKSRVSAQISVAELFVIAEGNQNLQLSNLTQRVNTMTSLATQLRNAVLNAKNQEALEGQRAITRLNDELLVEGAKSIGKTTIESKQLVYQGIFNYEAARDAIQTIIETADEINKVASELKPKLVQENKQIQELIDGKLDQTLIGLDGNAEFANNTIKKGENKSSKRISSSSDLKF